MSVAALDALRAALSDVTIDDPANAIEALQAAFAPIDPILTGGLAHEADLSRPIAGLAVAILLVVWLGISL